MKATKCFASTKKVKNKTKAIIFDQLYRTFSKKNITFINVCFKIQICKHICFDVLLGTYTFNL